MIELTPPPSPPMTTINSDMDTTCRAVFTQLVQAYGTTTIVEEDATLLITKINPTTIFSPIGPEWTTVRDVIIRYTYVEYLQTQTRDEPILTSMDGPPAGFTLTPSVSAFRSANDCQD